MVRGRVLVEPGEHRGFSGEALSAEIAGAVARDALGVVGKEGVCGLGGWLGPTREDGGDCDYHGLW